MFEDSLFESTGRLARRHPGTTMLSFAVQILACALVVVLSMLYTDGLPVHKLVSTLEAPPPPAAPAAQASHVEPSTRASEFARGVLTIPREIPKSITVVRDEQETIASGSQAPGIPNGISNAPQSAVISELLRITPTSALVEKKGKVRVSSGVAQGLLIRQVQPQYPPLARQARIQGTVVLQAVIGKDGTVQGLQIVSGHPMLTGAAIAAVKQWRYQPYYLNGGTGRRRYSNQRELHARE
jgi:periplasmic protein TonB